MRRLSWLIAALVALALTGLVGPASPARADTVHPEWGSTGRPDGVLRNGCHLYLFGYQVNPPPGDWAIEVFLTGPGPDKGTRTALANDAFLDGYDPETGVGKFTLCSASTRHGFFTIKTRLSVQNGPDEYTEGWLPPSHFHLTAPKRHHHRHHHR